jgi:PAP2 superfamily protein
VVSNPLAAERAVEAAKDSHDENQIRAARAIRRRTYVFEAALILAAYFVYGWVRGLVEGHTADAIHRAHQLVRLERSLHIYHEKALNHFVAHQHWLAYICNYWYAIMHFLVTIWVGVWVYWKHPEWARQLRTAWYSMNVVAIFGFAFLPLAPPRLLPGGGFIDTVVNFHTWGSWGSKSVSKDANLYAAMPSMHIGWSLWVAIAVVLLARRTWVRVLGALYPLATLFVIVGTANHYFLDAVGGVVACVGGILIARLITRRQVLPPLHRPKPLSAYAR